MEIDLNEIDRTLEQIPVDPIKRKERSASQDSTMEDDVAIAEAINQIEHELNEVEPKKREGIFTPSAMLMTAIVVGGIVTAQVLPFLFPK